MFKIIVATIIVYTIIFDITAVSFRFFPEKKLSPAYPRQSR